MNKSFSNTKTRVDRISSGTETRPSGGKSREAGFTLIEVLVTTILVAGLLVGFRYTLLAYMKQINRSWSERYMEQYGNSMVEFLARNIINAKEITIPPSQGDFAVFYVTYSDPNLGQYSVKFSGSEKDGILKDDEKIFLDFPPEEFESRSKSILGPNESMTLTEFRIDSAYRPLSPYFNPVEFKGRLFKITLMIKYEQKSTKKGAEDYIREMMFTSQVSLKNRKSTAQPPGT